MGEQKRLDRPNKKTKSIGQIIGEFAYNKPAYDFSKAEKERADKVADHIHELYVLSGYSRLEGLDRPELREKIERLEINFCFALLAFDAGHIHKDEMDLYRDYLIDQILALIPDIEEAKKQEGEKILKGKLCIVIAHKDNLVDVAEWAECQGVGVFVYFPDNTYWQALKEEK